MDNAIESAFHVVLLVMVVVIPVTCISYAVSDNIDALVRAFSRAHRRMMESLPHSSEELAEVDYPALFKTGNGRHRKV